MNEEKKTHVQYIHGLIKYYSEGKKVPKKDIPAKALNVRQPFFCYV
jgi:hypothetical protein